MKESVSRKARSAMPDVRARDGSKMSTTQFFRLLW